MNQVLISMENLAGVLSPWVRKLNSFDMLILCWDSTADGIEFFPIKCLATSEVVSDITEHGVYKAALQSWRSEKNLVSLLNFFINHAKQPKLCYLALASYFLITERRASIEYILALQQSEGNLPTSIFPHHTGVIGGQRWEEAKYTQFTKLNSRLVQPEPSLLQKDRWDVNSWQDFSHKAIDYGYNGFCLSRHIMNCWPDNWREAIEYFLPQTYLVRVNNDETGWGLLSMLKLLGYQGPIVVRTIPTPFMSREAFLALQQNAVAQARQVSQE